MKTERTITGRRKSILSKMNTVCNAKWEESTMCVKESDMAGANGERK